MVFFGLGHDDIISPPTNLPEMLTISSLEGNAAFSVTLSKYDLLAKTQTIAYWYKFTQKSYQILLDT